MRMLDPEMNLDEARCIFKAISKQKTEISQQELLKHLKDHSIKLQGLKLTNVQKMKSQ